MKLLYSHQVTSGFCASCQRAAGVVIDQITGPCDVPACFYDERKDVWVYTNINWAWCVGQKGMVGESVVPNLRCYENMLSGWIKEGASSGELPPVWSRVSRGLQLIRPDSPVAEEVEDDPPPVQKARPVKKDTRHSSSSCCC